MFVIDMRNRNLYIINRGSVKDTITSAYSESITDNVYTYASGGDYYTCAEMVFTQELTLLQGGRISQPMRRARGWLGRKNSSEKNKALCPA